jgi:ElaB/YqjD/DUF883 family membrane-anchored ribosome-binding protein
MRKAIVHYDTEDSADVQQTALLMGLESVLYELLETHGWLADDLRERCADVIDEAAERRKRGVARYRRRSKESVREALRCVNGSDTNE